MDVFKFLVFLSLTISHASTSTSLSTPTTSTSASTSTATDGSCESFTDTDDIVFISCLTGLYSLNLTGALSIDQGCRYYNHVLKCISNKLNGTCGVTYLHKHVPDYIRSKPGIRQQFFKECTVSDLLEPDGFCNDSAAFLISGISVCVPQEIPSSCDYIGSVFLKCYNKYGIDDYFQCSKREMRQAFEDESDWFLENWKLNMSLCWNGDNIIVDICSTPMLQNNISMRRCRFLVYNFDIRNIMSNKDMCRQYTYYLKCIEGLFEKFNTDGNYKCSLESLHKWVPSYFKAHMNIYNGGIAFNATLCNISEFATMDYCSDRRAVFLTEVNLCTLNSGEIFECGYIRTLVENCDQSWDYYYRPTNMTCTIRQRELAMESEAEYFKTKHSINVTNCSQDGVKYGQEICNKNVSDRDKIYSEFYNCFYNMGENSYFNRSGLLTLNEGCRIYNYAMHCVKKGLERNSEYGGCDIHSIEKWFQGEYYTKSTMEILVPNCNVTSTLNESFCKDSLAMFYGMVGFCYDSIHLKSLQTYGKKDICSAANALLQSCYYHKWDIVSQFGCTFADRESAIVNNAIVLNTRYGTDINMSSCFKGCLSSRSCYRRGSSTNWEVYASFNSSKCSCSYYCHGGYDNCCPDFYDGCVCTSDIWSYIDKDDCKYLISNFNKTETMNEDDVCRTYSYYLKCVQTQSRCPLEQLESLLSDYIRQNHNSLYRFNTSRCNVSMASSLSDFCSDERTLFQVGVNRECTKPRENEFFTCGYLDNKAHNCYNWYWASSLISCNHIQRKNAFLENSDWFYKTWNINISVCKEESVKICTAAPSMARNALYSRATLCFEDFHIWFNRSGLANSSDGCSFYMQILQCMKNGFGWTKPNKPCADKNLHDFLIQHVIQSTKIYDIIHSCNVSTSIDKTFCEDEEAKLAYLLGVCRRTPTILHGRILKNQSNICQILNSILVECHYEVRKPYFQCDFSDLYSPFDPKTGILAKRFNIDISDCFSGCGTSYACCTDGISSGYCIASFNGTECSCNDTCVDQQNCCTDFLEACHNISTVHPGVQTNDSQPRTPGDSFRFGAYEGDSMIFGDDTLSPIVLIPLGFPTENRFFDHLKIGTNGIILFSVERSFNPPTPVNFKQIGGIDFIAPFWTDIYVPEGRSHVYYHVYDKTKIRYIGDYTWYILKEVSEEISHFYKLKYFNAVWVLITTWDKVLPPSFSTQSEDMTFQCILATNGISSYAIFNYMSMNVTNVEGRQAAMGYRLSNYKMNDLSFNDAAFEINTFKGNVGLNGYYVYKLTNDNGKRQNYKQLCYNWYDKYRDEKSTIFDRISMERFNCPCTLRNIRFDWRWMKMLSPTKGVSCFTLFATTLLPATRSCCYNDYYGSYIRIHPSAGSYHMFHPVFAPRSFATEESLPKEYCCLRSNLCNLYYSLRKIGNCYGKLPFKYRWFYGDPHIESLDGKQYTFNGIGEYVLMKIVNENVIFELQARTERILKENGTYSNATVFTAFAMKEENTTFQVELTDDRKKLVVFSNEYDYTKNYNQNPDFSVITEHIKLSRHSNTLVVVFGISGLQINITLGIRMLTFSTTVPDDFAGQTVGLVGNFDGDDKNDFILPNGTILTENQTRTERQIFYNFGEHWAINETESVFKYPHGKSPGDYRDRDFIPIFIEDFEQEDVVKAKTVCGNKTSSAACIYDYLLTKDESIGKDSGRVKVEAIETVKSSENKVPVIWGDRSVNATIGIPTKIQVHGKDDGNFSYHVISGPKTNFNMDETKSFYTWTPNDATPVNISITVIDNFGVFATPLDIQITICGNCSNHGYCIFNETVPQTTLFEYAKCVCEQGWTGYQCENDVNGCSGHPCSDGRNCTDLTPAEEANFGRSFNCSSCPKGYKENDKNKCSDINECETESNICTQQCVNSIGSFFCGCETGFTLTDGYKCIDINECDMKNVCEQLCTNTDGSYNCSCIYGYSLNSDSKTCTKQSQENFCKNISCSYTCDKNKEGKFHCICPKGFHLSSDERSCEDDDECTNRICQHNCKNTNGSFVCSCHAGYTLETDGFSCKECEIRKWGLDCANYCDCVNGKCDPVFGCQCDAGFSGSKCDEDVNECKISGICNDTYKTCINTYGSYNCKCQDGYHEENKTCKNINECSEVTSNQCDEKTTTCVDTIGSYTCVCKPGYNVDSLHKCKDIDECSLGNPCEQICVNNDGSYQCQCQNGFSIMDDRSHCKKLSDYELCGSLNCSYSCTLSNGNISCFCPSGAELDTDRKTCKDIDECANNRTNKCSFEDRCSNIERGYTCSCPDGFRLENDERTCKECNGTGWGPNCENKCNCAPGAVFCDSTKGCVCQSGYNGTYCENDVDECAENPCDGQHEYCENIPGSFLCKCHQGYSNISSKCTNIDECITGLNNCEHICTDFDGGFNCSCHPGFYLTDTGKCKDINECQPGRHNCDQICKNTIGSFQCLCNEGYLLNTTTRHSCFIKKTCSSPNNCSHLCAVHGGKEKCSCRQGYMLHKDGITCENINECKQDIKICDQICTDLTPGYNCSCNPGYYLDVHNGKTCKECESGYFGINCSLTCQCSKEKTYYCDRINGSCLCKHGWTGMTCETDINECQNNVCQNNTLCKNTNGSYECLKCDNGFVNGDRSECFETSHSKTLQTTGANELPSNIVTKTHSTEKTTIPEHQSIKLQVNLTIDIGITSKMLKENMTFYKHEAQKMLKDMYNRIENAFIQVIKLSVGSLHILYDVMAYKKQSAEIAIVLYDVVEGKITLKFKNSRITVKRANIVLTNDLPIVIDPKEDRQQSLCKIYSSITECSLDDCEVKGGYPKCRETSTDSSFTSGLAIGLISGISLIMFIIILAIVLKFINYKKKIKYNKRTSSQDIDMVDTKHIETNYKNKYDPFPQTMDHSTDKYRVGTNDYCSISSGSSWREMFTDDYQSLYSTQFKIQRPAMKSTINNS